MGSPQQVGYTLAVKAATILAAVIAIGCSDAHDRVVEAAPPTNKTVNPKAPGGKAKPMAEELSGKIERQKDALHVTYHFENHATHAVYVNDGNVIQVTGDRWELFQRNYDTSQLDPDTVQVTIGVPPDGRGGTAPPQRYFVKVPPGGAFDGARDVELDAGMKPKRLKIGLFLIDGEPEGWFEVTTQKGSVRLPRVINTPIRMAVSGPLPLP